MLYKKIWTVLILGVLLLFASCSNFENRTKNESDPKMPERIYNSNLFNQSKSDSDVEYDSSEFDELSYDEKHMYSDSIEIGNNMYSDCNEIDNDTCFDIKNEPKISIENIREAVSISHNGFSKLQNYYPFFAMRENSQENYTIYALDDGRLCYILFTFYNNTGHYAFIKDTIVISPEEDVDDKLWFVLEKDLPENILK